MKDIDTVNTNDLADLLKIYGWIRISDFGTAADQNAWLLVQHADHDPVFQKEILGRLGKLYKSGETSPQNYAYLVDRVAASWGGISAKEPFSDMEPRACAWLLENGNPFQWRIPLISMSVARKLDLVHLKTTLLFSRIFANKARVDVVLQW